MTVSGVVSGQVVAYNGEIVTLLRVNDDVSRWTVRLDALLWEQKELIVRTRHLCGIDQSKQQNHEQGRQWAMCGGDKMTLRGLVSAQIYDGQNVTLLRANDDGSRWTVRLDSVVWKQRELIVKPGNLRAVDIFKALPDKVLRLSQPSIDSILLINR